MVVVLDNIRSVHNVGSIFRTADAVGIEKIYLCGITPTPLTPLGKKREDFHKVALGAEDPVAWEHVRSASVLLRRLKREGFCIFALEQAKNSILYYSVSRKSFLWNRSVLVLGNEPKGLSKRVFRLCDAVLEIPMRGRKESLNVSVAFGIVAYHLATISSIFPMVER